MDNRTVMNLGFILAESARVEAMKAANTAAELTGRHPPHDADDFNVAAFQLEKLARQAGEG